MKVALFLGTRIGYEALEVLSSMEADIVRVYADREHSHETERYFEKILQLCESLSIPVSENASHTDIYEGLRGVTVDYIFCFGFRRLIEPRVLNMANIAACSTHFSLLPAYRGFAPVNWAMINGESQCGVSLFHMEKDADSGDVAAQKAVPIGPDDYISTVMDRCVTALKELLTDQWPLLKRGTINRTVQDDTRATYTCSRNPEDGCIDWSSSTDDVYNLIRALSKPFPGAYTTIDGKRVTIWTAEPYETGPYVGRIPGKVVSVIRGKGVVVLTGDGALLLRDVKAESSTGEERADQLIKSVRVTLGR